ncbi:fimbrial protein [Achromobacter seleniivolatilans]|uniref:Fimbrial protein n=1 Tax=Achromobacter seleniivolatilans TaxID=3047478 RepID=A0ABY9M1E2_9BURK|nr:fimbrial protein [Achromobacter sp. R39]WMD20813.1 fimbrial protein [Achromobacter sp. R39]
MNCKLFFRCKIWLRVALAGVCLGVAGPVLAACVVQGVSAPVSVVNFGNFPNPNRTSVTGEIIGAPVVLNFSVTCRRASPAQLQTLLHFGSVAVPGRREGSFASGIDGLDVDVTLNVGPVQTNSQVRALDFPLGYQADDASVNISYTFQLVKSLPKAATGVALSVPQLAEVSYTDDSTGGAKVSLLSLRAQGNPIQAIGCTVSPASNRVSVRLPTVSTLALSGSGVTAGRTSFALLLQCGDARTDVFIALTDANQPGNTTSVLTLDAGSTAKNIGVNILRADGVPVIFGPESYALGTANQWFAGSMTGAGVIDLSAQYVATGQPVIPGTVGASALFTLSYQ